MSGVLTLVPIPLNDLDPLDSKAKEILEKAVERKDLILVEEAKPCRRRWLNYGLPREAIDDFELYNEHNQIEKIPSLVSALKSGKNIFLMSDCGLPAFCDPGTKLVRACHENNIKVSSTPFSNSIALALAMSGFEHKKFVFEGFLPSKNPDRQKEISRVLKEKRASIIMDTPYRLSKLLEEIENAGCRRKIFLALDLTEESEAVFLDEVKKIRKKIGSDKRKFILIIGAHNE